MHSYKLKVKLHDSDPAITRTRFVPKDITFRDLHQILQVAMGWKNSYTYEFGVKSENVIIAPPGAKGTFVSKLDDRRIKLSDYEYRDFRYVYDFTDKWVHDIHFLKDTDLERPKVMKYEGNCPPEDCGGLTGYYRMMDIMSDAEHPEYEETKCWYDTHSFEYDADGVNGYLENVWTPYDRTKEIPEAVFYRICNLFEIFDDKDRYFDPSNMGVVEYPRGTEPAEGLVPIVISPNSEIIYLMDIFMDNPTHRPMLRSVGNVRNAAIRYRRFMSVVKKNRALSYEWDRFLDKELYNTGIGWAMKWGFEVEVSEESDEKSSEEVIEDLMSSIVAMMEEDSLKKRPYVCPNCGASVDAVLDHEGRSSTIYGVDIYPAKLDCKSCGTGTTLRKKSDGIHVGYHYDGWEHPCAMVESVLLKFISAKKEVDPTIRFDRLTELFVPMWRLGMDDQVKECSVLMHEASDDDPVRIAILDTIDAFMGRRIVSESSKQHISAMHRHIAMMMVFNLEEWSDDFQEVLRMHSFADETFDAWGERDDEYFILRRTELLCYTLDEKPVDASQQMIDLLREAIDRVAEAPMEFDGIHWQMAAMVDEFAVRLWRLGFNEELKVLMDVAAGYSDREGASVPNSIRSIIDYRRAIVEMTMGDGIAAAEPLFRKVIENIRSLKDTGPATVMRALVSSLILYRNGMLEEKDLMDALPMFKSIYVNKAANSADIGTCLSFATYCLLRDRSFEESMKLLSETTSLYFEQDEAEMIDSWESPWSVWDLGICYFAS